MVDSQRFVDLRRPRRIWAVAAVHAEVGRLAALHDDLGVRFRPGDRLVYLGNLIGRGPHVAATIEELLMFRRALLAVPGMFESDIVYLRGGQEEMWQKLLQLQLAPNPRDIMEWMLSQGVGATLAAYGATTDQATAAARDGVRTITRFTNGLRAAMRESSGHEPWFSTLRRAAFTGSPTGTPVPEPEPAPPLAEASEGEEAAVSDCVSDGPEPALVETGGVLMVSTGFDIGRSFEAQGDAFWWGGAQFAKIDRRYGGFARIVRGYDPAHGGVRIGPYTTTLDGGCGFGGPLICGCLSPGGVLLDTIEA